MVYAHTSYHKYWHVINHTSTLFQLLNFILVLRNFRLEFLVQGGDFLGLHVLKDRCFLLMVLLLMAKLFLKLLKQGNPSVYNPVPIKWHEMHQQVTSFHYYHIHRGWVGEGSSIGVP